MSASTDTHGIHGLMAEFESATQLVAAANKTREAGFVDVDAYSPIPIEELHHAIGFKSTKLPLMVFRIPGMRSLQGFIYRWVADHRYRFPGTTPYCESHPVAC